MYISFKKRYSISPFPKELFRLHFIIINTYNNQVYLQNYTNNKEIFDLRLTIYELRIRNNARLRAKLQEAAPTARIHAG